MITPAKKIYCRWGVPHIAEKVGHIEDSNAASRAMQ